MDAEPRPVRLAYSYVAADLGTRRRLGVFLAGLRRRMPIREIDLGALDVGAGRREQVLEALESADVILMLLSSDYIACEETWSLHLPIALDATRRGTHLVPICVRPVALAGLPIGGRERLPRFVDSVLSAPDQDVVLVEICEEISAIVDELVSGFDTTGTVTADDYRPRRVLLAFANPRLPGSDSNIGIGKECDEIRGIFAASSRSISVRSLSGASLSSIAAALREHQPDLVHLGAHVTSTGLLMLEDSQSNAPDPVDPSRLVELLTMRTLEPRCLVLNTCHSLVFSLMVQACIEHVVGLWGRTGDEAARCYARGFYAALARGESVAMAHEGGLIALRKSEQSTAAQPVYLRQERGSRSHGVVMHKFGDG